MSSKKYYRDRIADKRKDIVSLRADIKEIKEKYSKKSESLRRSIKNTTSKGLKESYRKIKITAKRDKDNKVESLKKKIEYKKKEIDRLKEKLAKAK